MLGLLVAAVVGGCLDSPSGSEQETFEPDVGPDMALLEHLRTLEHFPELRFETSHGTIRAIAYTQWLPQTTDHILALAADGFYDGTIVHRVVNDFVIQGGDPTTTGEGGSGPGGLSTNMVPLEIKDGLQFQSGALGLARWTEDTGDSQWFIAEQPALHLDNPQGQPNELLGPYALFAQVFEGLDVVRSIAQVETLPNDRPISDVVVENVEVLAPPTDADLIGLIVDVIDNYEMGRGVGQLEVPRFAVAGHPLVVRFTSDNPDCSMEMWGEHKNWTQIDGEVCVYEKHVLHDEPGPYWIGGTDAIREGYVQSHEYHVLPWHDAYASYTGRS